MTKQQELDILDEAIGKLGPLSYCGAWLAEVRHEVARDLRSDLEPVPTIGATRRQCAEMVGQAQGTVNNIIDAARSRAIDITDAARKECDRIHGAAMVAVRDALRALEAMR